MDNPDLRRIDYVNGSRRTRMAKFHTWRDSMLARQAVELINNRGLPKNTERKEKRWNPT